MSKDIPDDVVAAGVLARKIKTIDEYKSEIIKNAIYIFEIGKETMENEILKKYEFLFLKN